MSHSESSDASRPWLSSYPAGMPAQVDAGFSTFPEAWAHQVAKTPEDTALIYFDKSFTYAEVDQMTSALSAALQQRGVTKGVRVGIKLQNIPQFSLVLLSLYKLGAIGVLINPMYRGRELAHIIEDSAPIGIVTDDQLFSETAETAADTSVEWIITTSNLDFQSRNDPRVFSFDPEKTTTSPDGDLVELITSFDGSAPDPVELDSSDVALLSYTSGTTGPAKGAKNTHGNLLSIAASNQAWLDFQPGDVMYAVAPLFHITGVGVVHSTPLLYGGTLVFGNRPHPEVIAELYQEHSVNYLVGSITLFNAIMRSPAISPQQFASTKAMFSGGAPIPAASVKAFQDRFGYYIHNSYGLTESTSGITAVPFGQEAPVHQASGTLSIGVPQPGVIARIVDPFGEEVPLGEEGELEVAGPQIVPGYWNNPEATEKTFPGGRLRTGDAAIMDTNGWIYLLDRLKDQINASGFKVWPREVEDVLYEHPAVYEAAIIGKPDEYRGETVVAYVSLKPGQQVTEDELIEFTKERLAAYKYPREVTIMDELPKTETGKIQRRVLRSTVTD